METNSSHLNATAFIAQQFYLPLGTGLPEILMETIVTFLMFLSCVGNSVNIAVFLRMRLKDVMTLCLFALSVSDLISSAIGGFAALGNRLKASVFGPLLQFYIDIDNLWAYALSMVLITQNISNNITTLVAIERCLCVAVPFKAKSIITLGRTRVAILFFIVLSIVTNIPNYTTSMIAYRFNPVLNLTRLEIVYTAGRMDALNLIGCLNFLVWDPISLVTVTVTSYIMIRGLKRSSRFRQVMASNHTPLAKTDSPAGVLNNGSKAQPCPENGAPNDRSHQPQQLSDNNVRLVKMLLIVSISGAVIHFCAVVTAIGSLIVPEFSFYGRYIYEYSLLVVIFQFCYSWNMGINTILYYHYNTKFRRAFIDLAASCGCISVGDASDASQSQTHESKR